MFCRSKRLQLLPSFFFNPFPSREASHNPLSFQEKSDLISQIHKLEPTHMDEVIKIVQSAYPSALQDSEEFEVPLDELDTLTLRKLQRYIDNAVGSKKRRPGSVNMNISHQSSSTMVTGESNKKPRRASQSEGYNVIPTDSITIMSHTTSVEVRASISGEQDEEHMLFSAEELLDSHAPKGPQIENDDIENFSGNKSLRIMYFQPIGLTTLIHMQIWKWM